LAFMQIGLNNTLWPCTLSLDATMPKADSSSPTPSSSVSSDQSETSTSRRKSSTTNTNAAKTSKPRLTAHQKNTNHKDAENKRRNAIRDQFLELSRIVPGAKGQERSEYVMLQKTVSYLKKAMEERRELVQAIEKRGGIVEDDVKLGEENWGGKEWRPKGLEEWCKAKGKDINKLEDEDDGGEGDDG